MRLTYTTRFEAQGTFAEKDIPKDAKFRWDPDRKVWWTADPTRAMLLRAYADDSAQAQLEGITATLEASRATDADIDIPVPEGLELFGFQKAGIQFASTRPATLIGDEMGLGKTLQAIGVINLDPSIQKILVIAPLSVKLNWRNELNRWLVRNLTIGIADAKNLPETDIVIIHPDVLVRHDLHSIEWDLVVLDEAHLFKSPKAKRSQVVFGSRETPQIKARRKLALTGTPIPNRPIEIYPILKWLDPNEWGNWRRFATRYCSAHQTQWGWDVSGASNLPELQERLRTTVMIRRKKMDVLTELPPKFRQIITLDPSDIENGWEAIDAESQVIARTESMIADAQAEVDQAENTEAYNLAVTRLRAAQNLVFESLSKVRHETALVKVPTVASHVRDLLEGGVAKVGVWAHHRDVIARLVEALGDFHPASIVGGDAPDRREEAVRRFQEDPECRVFIGSIQAAGVGITLTAASTAVFAELDWVPGNVSQAEDRHHRIGTTENVTIQHIVIDESIDAKLAKTLIAKQKVIDKSLDIEPLTEVHKDKLVRELILPDLTPEQIDAIHEALRYLADYDEDHARDQNGVGFSKIDVQIGHSLAKSPTLTLPQAALGQRLARKYRRQLPSQLKERIGI